MTSATRGNGRLTRALVGWVDATRRHSWLVVLGVLALTAVTLPPAVARLNMHVDPLAMLREDLPYRQLRSEYFEAFPRELHTLLLVVDADTPDHAHDAADQLATRLAEDSELFPFVFLPGGGPFFERNGLLYREASELEDLADRLAEYQPFIAELSVDPSLRGFFGLLGDAVERADAERSADLLPVIDRVSQVMEARLAGEPMSLSWQDLLFGAGEADRSRRVIVVQPALDYANLQPARDAILAIRRIASELGLDRGLGPRMRLTGQLALNFEEIQVLRVQGRQAGLLSFLLVTGILLFALRRPSLVLFTAITLLVGLAWTVTFAAYAIGHLNMVSVAFTVLFIGLGVDFGIHLCMRYRELAEGGMPHPEALRATAQKVGGSLLLCAMTTSIGFYAFAPTDYLGVAELGVISGTGMFLSFFLTLTLLPALISLRPTPPHERRRQPSPRVAQLMALPARHAWAVVSGAGVLAAGIAVLLPSVRFDHNPLRVRDPSTESVRTFEDLLEEGGTSPWTIEIVESDLAAAGALAARIRDLPEVERAVTAADFVPEDQAEKLEILSDVALFVGPPGDASRRVEGSVDRSTVVRALIVELDARLARGGDPDLMAALTRFRSALVEVARRDGEQLQLEQLESDLLGTLPGRLRLLREALKAGPVSLSDLPAELRESMVTADGRARIHVRPAADISDNRELARFVDSVSSLSAHATGPAPGLLAAGRAIVGAFQEALLSALFVITLLLILMWRRLGDALLVLGPLLLASGLTAAASVVFDIPFNFADVIVVPLLLGIGVDSGIHLVSRYRSGEVGPEALLSTSTAGAVLMSALTTIASFGALGLASHRGMASMGQLLTLGVCFMLACNLILLPALMELSRRRAERG